MTTQPVILSVSALNAMARDILEHSFTNIWISGEISNFTQASSGHAYFLLKDNHAQIRCVLFKNQISKLNFSLENGKEIEVCGRITLYEARGEFQINITEVRETGLGQLFIAYEALKQKLGNEGLFDNDKKQPLPLYPQKIGIITSRTAAALYDVVSTIQRRVKAVSLIVYPTPVQGKGSENQIAQAIQKANERAEVDMLIICRGGGSMEDLWAFNEEVTVRAIANSHLPIISGVGHETDFTLCDFVADVRAPTPTGAGEIATQAMLNLQQNFITLKQELNYRMQQWYQQHSQQLDVITSHLYTPRMLFERQKNTVEQTLIQLQDKMVTYYQDKTHRLNYQKLILEQNTPQISSHQQTIHNYHQQLKNLWQTLWQQRSQRLQHLTDVLTASSPQAIMQRGFSIVTDKRGKIINDSNQLRFGQKVNIAFHHGKSEATINSDSLQKDLFD